MDNNKWQEYDNNERVLRDIDNALFISSDSRKKMGGGGIVSKFYIAGDFDAEISYKIEKWSEDYASLFFFIANWARDSWIRKEYISIRNLRYYSNSVSNDVYSALRNSRGVFQAYGTQNTKDMKGKLRIKRTHGEIFTYYGSYGEWILLQSYKEEDNQPFRVGVGIRNWNRNHGPSSIRVRFTDFKLKLSPDVLIKKESEDKKKENKNRWVKVVFKNYESKPIYVQWLDVGPWNIDDEAYVFSGGRVRPQAESGWDKGMYGKRRKTNRAGIDLSQAVFNYLGIKASKSIVHWKFVKVAQVPSGPWKKYISDGPAKY